MASCSTVAFTNYPLLVKSKSILLVRHFSSSETTPSNRAKFKAIPTNPYILNHIQSIGVGIPERTKRPTIDRFKKSRLSRTLQRGGKGGVLSASEEDQFLQRSALKRSSLSRTAKGRPPAGSKKTSDDSLGRIVVGPAYLPPPPFASTVRNDESTGSGRTIRRRPVKVVGSVGAQGDSFPAYTLPEVALAGRSNVGKSTLLNALLYGNQSIQSGDAKSGRELRGRVPEGAKLPRGVKAVTSDRPGTTRRITFYKLASKIIDPKEEAQQTQLKQQQSSSTPNDQTPKDEPPRPEIAMLLVDLPGYGFAYTSEEKAEEWKELMQHYLLHRGKALKRILLLIDARHGMKKADVEFLEALQSVLYAPPPTDSSDLESDNHRTTAAKNARRQELPPIQLVLTKCDLVSQVDLARRVVLSREQLSDSLRREPSSLPVMLVSAKPGVGFNNVQGERAMGGVLELQREIAALALQPKFPKKVITDTATRRKTTKR